MIIELQTKKEVAHSEGRLMIALRRTPNIHTIHILFTEIKKDRLLSASMAMMTLENLEVHPWEAQLSWPKVEQEVV